MARPTQPLPDADADSLRYFCVGGGCCVLAPPFAQLFTIPASSITFCWSFLQLTLVRPHCAGSRGDRCGHQGESPADLMAATDSDFLPAFVQAGKSIFPSDDFVWRRRAPPLSVIEKKQ
ncbi:hypothetical protein [Rhizobium sp. J15]|uniref:hypothetical protein n=1 Tax=Rhizobium sp. J15 TaxID=2035450 RepID=UPI0015965E89|nr:hypothetical protein [Rhizobium sp. J15]